MLSKCANPVCTAPFRKLGDGKLFAFESAAIAPSGEPGSSRKGAQSPVVFWLCKCCSLSFTVQLDVAGELMLLRVADGVRGTIFGGHSLDQVG